MKTIMFFSLSLIAGGARAGTCFSADHTVAATVAAGTITVSRLNGVTPGGSIVKEVKVLSPLDARGSQGQLTLKAKLSDGGRTAIRFETENGDPDLSQAKLKSIRIAYHDGNLEIYATDCR